MGLEPARGAPGPLTRLGVLVACALGALAPVETASPAIVIGRGIGGVAIGMSQKAVRSRLGRPRRVLHAKNEFGPYTEFRYGGYVVDFQGNATLTSVITTLARERTPAGVGVGSTWVQVRAKVPHVICQGVATLADCHVGELLPGKKVTDFFIRLGKVSRVIVGIVLD
jgi:hypothetical protein